MEAKDELERILVESGGGSLTVQRDEAVPFPWYRGELMLDKPFGVYTAAAATEHDVLLSLLREVG
jgi:hypothetical protein